MNYRIKRVRLNAALFSLVTGIVLLSSGCNGGGSNLGSVTGVVQLDGQPLANASVSFHPATGRGSFATTGEDGRYVLDYHKGKKGAVLGAHKVTITTKTWSQPKPKCCSTSAAPSKHPSKTLQSEGSSSETLRAWIFYNPLCCSIPHYFARETLPAAKP